MGWRIVAVLGLAAASCVRSVSEDCGDHLVCGSGQVCLHASDGTNAADLCVDPAQFADCRDAGRPELAECDDGHGRCYDGACVPIACGDGLVDPGTAMVDPEQCDDLNTLPGDGCSADCRSNEQCGNGIVDPIAFEICDDGNLRSHDGCTDRCKSETPRWTEVLPGAAPRRDNSAIAYLPTIGRSVMFGGTISAINDDATWEWDGTGWFQISTLFTPPPRNEHAMAYDSDRQVVVMTGGIGKVGTVGETWEWNGSRWRLATPDGPARERPSLAYDPRRHRLVLFGGIAEVGPGVIYHGETFEWGGAKWEQVDAPDGTQTQRPEPRAGAAMAYDPVHGVVVLFGGHSSSAGRELGDTWTWDGTTWTEHVVAGPSAREGAAFSADARGLVLYGGEKGLVRTADTWRWNGTSWTDLQNARPGPRAYASATTDLSRGRIVMVGGTTLDNSVWEWDGADWSSVDPIGPGVAARGAAGFDQRRARGLAVTTTSTFAIHGGAWTSLGAAPTSDRLDASAVFDTALDHLAMFGGRVGAVGLGDTWWLDGATSTWTQPPVTTSPTARFAAGIAYDRDRRRTVLFGGFAPLADDQTWELDTDWHQLHPALSPTPRGYPALGYDPIRERAVLFGGSDGTALLDDTWEWDGATWTRHTISGPAPVARYDAGFVWNPVRQRLTLIGGDSAFGHLDDAWEWDGSAWQELATQVHPPKRVHPIAVPTSDGTGILMSGGEDEQGNPYSDSWLLRWAADDTRDELCLDQRDLDADKLLGCADPDCWASCAPLCLPGTACAAAEPRCGDGVVGPAETCELCPADATACPLCGDLLCEPPETMMTCPGDCL